MAEPRFADIALNELTLLRDGAYGESVAERDHGLKMLLRLITKMPITRKHSQLIAMIEGLSLFFGNPCHKEAIATAITHIRRHMPKGLRADKMTLRDGSEQFPEKGYYSTL